jgi:hypothetical protein
MPNDDYQFDPEQSSAILHSIAAGRLADSYSAEDYLRELEQARLENPDLYKTAFSSGNLAEAEQLRRIRETKGAL